ncbi:hypothetical protein GCM10009621_07510 [Corynebacterium felinum]
MEGVFVQATSELAPMVVIIVAERIFRNDRRFSDMRCPFTVDEAEEMGAKNWELVEK